MTSAAPDGSILSGWSRGVAALAAAPVADPGPDRGGAPASGRPPGPVPPAAMNPHVHDPTNLD
jgi:hypothetical protein